MADGGKRDGVPHRYAFTRQIPEFTITIRAPNFRALLSLFNLASFVKFYGQRAHWKVYEVFRDGKAFNLRHHISKVVILPGDYKLMKIDRTAKMTKAQALEIGEAAERWESGNQTEEKKSRRSGNVDAGPKLL